MKPMGEKPDMPFKRFWDMLTVYIVSILNHGKAAIHRRKHWILKP